MTEPEQETGQSSTERTSYFTFGFQHAHAHCGFTYDKDIVVEITAAEPRAVMVQAFGTAWCWEYHSLDEVHLEHYPRGVKVVTPQFLARGREDGTKRNCRRAAR